MGRRLHAGKANHFSGFLSHCVKEKGYTQGTKVKKGHGSCVAINSLPFSIWTEIKANGLILTHSQSAHLITDKSLGVVSHASLPCDHPGSYCKEKRFLFQSLTLPPYHSPQPVTSSPFGRSCRRTVRGEGDKRGRRTEDGYTWEIGPVGQGKRL